MDTTTISESCHFILIDRLKEESIEYSISEVRIVFTCSSAIRHEVNLENGWSNIWNRERGRYNGHLTDE